jgi:nicotinamidase-related amidase
MFFQKEVPLNKIDLVVVVDVQYWYSHIIHRGDNEMFLTNVKEVLEYFNKKGTKIIFVEYADSGMTLPEVYGIVGKRTQKITCLKYTTGAFDSGDFKKVLEKESKNSENILFLGLENNFCLLETVRSALLLKYNVIISYDLMTGSDYLYNSAKAVYEKCSFLDYVFQSNNKVA